MDVKIGDFAVTPRNGKVVEINALWYNALKTLENLANKYEDFDTAKKCKSKANAHKKVFNKVFYNEKKKSLFDVLGDDQISYLLLEQLIQFGILKMKILIKC